MINRCKHNPCCGDQNNCTHPDPEPWPEKEAGVAELVDSWRAFINDRPQLLSFLYDTDMMPEQIVTMRGARSLDAVCCVYTAAEKGQIPPGGRDAIRREAFEEAAAAIREHHPDASFGDSADDVIERQSLLENVAREVLALSGEGGT